MRESGQFLESYSASHLELDLMKVKNAMLVILEGFLILAISSPFTKIELVICQILTLQLYGIF